MIQIAAITVSEAVGGKTMTVNEFCRNKTQAHQLCVIRDCGWIVEAVWIDNEDLFRMSDASKTAEVKSTEFGDLPIMTEHGDTVHVPCLYINT